MAIEIRITEWHSRLRMGSLRKDLYWMHIAPGKTDEEALRNTSKELKRLIKVCDQKIKELTKND